MTIIQKLLDAGIPVIVNESDELAGQYSYTSLTPEQMIIVNVIIGGWSVIKGRRNQLLRDCDWTQNPDVALTLAEKTTWQDYRQTLRDIPQDFVNPEDVIFPEVP